MPRKSVPAGHDWPLENAGDDLRTERDRIAEEWNAENDDMQLEREGIAEDKLLQAFVDFAGEVLGLRPGDFRVILDEVGKDGWRVLDLDCSPAFGQNWLSTIYLSPASAGKFPPSLDIPF